MTNTLTKQLSCARSAAIHKVMIAVTRRAGVGSRGNVAGLLVPLVLLFANGCATVESHSGKSPTNARQSGPESPMINEAVQVLRCRAGLQSVMDYVNAHPEWFPPARVVNAPLLRREEKEAIWQIWQRFLEFHMALGGLEKEHDSFSLTGSTIRTDSFLIGHGAFLARYRFALDLIDRLENHPELDKVLNEPVPEIGLPAGGYSQLKALFLNVVMGTRFAAREVILNSLPKGNYVELRAGLREDARRLWQLGAGRGEILTIKNALAELRNTGHRMWYPVQAGVSEWMGDTKVRRRGRSLVSAEQIGELAGQLRPGDILLERREWFLSNIGLPGYWPHAALYVGTAAERRTFFADDSVLNWVRAQGEPNGDFEVLLQTESAVAYRLSSTAQEHGHAPRVLEAMSEGVSFTTIEHSADCDSLAVLRPRLPLPELARAIRQAFRYAGRPYDFEFDFATDTALVCTELVYKAYEPALGMKGLTFPVIEMLGRKVTPANWFARQFDNQYGSREQQSDLILFLDGREREQRAVRSTVEEFRQSWRRPKWYVLLRTPTK